MIYALSVHIIYLGRTSASNPDHASRISHLKDHDLSPILEKTVNTDEILDP